MVSRRRSQLPWLRPAQPREPISRWPLAPAAVGRAWRGRRSDEPHLVSVGVTAVSVGRVLSLLLGRARHRHCECPILAHLSGGQRHTLYLDVSRLVRRRHALQRTWRRGRAQSRRPPSAPWPGLAAKTVAVLRDGTEQRVPSHRVAAGVSVHGPARGDHRAAVSSTAVRRRCLAGHRGIDARRGEPGDEVIGSCVSMELVVQASRVTPDRCSRVVSHLVSTAAGCAAPR